MIITNKPLTLKDGIRITSNESKENTTFADGKYIITIPAGATGYFKPSKIRKRRKKVNDIS